MDKLLLKETIKKANLWWSEKYIEQATSFKGRAINHEIEKYLPKRQIIALTGLRRVGKTTLMMNMIRQKLKDGLKPKNILYFSFDEYSDIRIMHVIELYENLTQKIDASQNYFIVLDEVQKIKNWSEQMKVVYDLYPNLKCIVSGSESLFIRRKSRESLAGRIFEFQIPPLTFSEFLEFRGVKIDNFFLQKEQIFSEFKQFLITNGFPEIIDYAEDEARKYIQEGIIDKILYRDISEVFDVKNTSLVKSLFTIIYNDPGQLIEIQELAKELGASRQIVSQYLEYLEESFIIKKLYNYSKNERKTQRKLKRYYSTLGNSLLIDSNFPKIFEQYMVIQLGADFFWRDSSKNEVDIIKPDPPIAIEIKSGEVKERDLAPLRLFIKKFNPKEALVITYDIKKTLCGIKLLPFYEYLLKKQG